MAKSSEFIPGFAASDDRGSAPWAESGATKLPPRELHSTSQPSGHQSFELCVSISALSLFILSVL